MERIWTARRMINPLLPIFLLLLFQLLFLPFYPDGHNGIGTGFADDSLFVDAVRAGKGKLTPAVRVAGTIHPVWQATLAGNEGGRLLALGGRPGDHLASGGLAWSIDDTDLRLALETARRAEDAARSRLAELKAGTRDEEIARLTALRREAEQHLAQIETERKRLVPLRENKVLAPNDWDRITFQENRARQQVAAAGAALNAAQKGPRAEQVAVLAAEVARAKAATAQVGKRVSDCLERAPQPCVILKRFKEPGEMLKPGEPVLDVAALATLTVTFHLGESELAGLEPGREITISFPGIQDVATGTLRAIIPQADPTSHRFPCEAFLQNPAGTFLPGMTAEVMLRQPAIEGILLPRTALLNRQDGSFVYVIRDGKAVPQAVKILGQSADQVVLQGLESGESVVSRGGFGLQPGASVNIRK